MTREAFDAQIARLKGRWKKDYFDERVELIFNAVKKLPDGWMENTVTWFIGNGRSAPLQREFLGKAQEYEQDQRFQLRNNSPGGFDNVLSRASKYTPNKEFAQKCLEVLRNKISGKYNKAQFLQACDYLDQVAAEFKHGGRE